MKAQIETRTVGTTVEYRCVHLDDRYRGKGTLCKCHGWTLFSSGSPELIYGDRSLFLFGFGREYDRAPRCTTTYRCATVSEAKRLEADLHALVEAFNAAPEWETEEKKDGCWTRTK